VDDNQQMIPRNSELIMYQTEDGKTRIDVRMENETVWLTQAQIAELFQRDRSVISKHIKNVFAEGEHMKYPRRSRGYFMCSYIVFLNRPVGRLRRAKSYPCIRGGEAVNPSVSPTADGFLYTSEPV
jgi:phage regulator Rha-like protein